MQPRSSLVLPCAIDVDGAQYSVRARDRGVEVLIADHWHRQDAVVIHSEDELRAVVRAFVQAFASNRD